MATRLRMAIKTPGGFVRLSFIMQQALSGRVQETVSLPSRATGTEHYAFDFVINNPSRSRVSPYATPIATSE
jgi:hypothetical protein